jgi:GNAT superfamily N-acetyltransferase
MRRAITIKDHGGRDYRVEILDDDEDKAEIDLRFNILDHRLPIGYANCVLDPPDTMKLCDICIHDGPHLGDLGYLKYCWLTRRMRRLTTYRGSGLGTALLRIIIETARKKGCRRMAGSVTPEADEDEGRLVRWYYVNGFTILPPDRSFLKRSVGELELIL